MNLNLILSQMGISQKIAQDVVLVLVMFSVSLIFGLLVGRYKLVTVLVNTYVSIAVLSVLPSNLRLEYSYALGIFLLIITVLTVLDKKMFDVDFSGAGGKFLLRIFVMSFLEIALLLSVVLSLLPKKIALSYISQNAYEYFVSSNFAFFWMVIPLIVLFIINRRNAV